MKAEGYMTRCFMYMCSRKKHFVPPRVSYIRRAHGSILDMLRRRPFLNKSASERMAIIVYAAVGFAATTEWTEKQEKRKRCDVGRGEGTRRTNHEETRKVKA
jgi:hypothetical protein